MTKKYTPHVHAEVIKAWADGKTIQFKMKDSDEWGDANCSSAGQWLMFLPLYFYRIKPEEVVDYAVVHQDGMPGVVFKPTIACLVGFYSANNYQGFLKRTQLDGQVVSFEFISK